MIAFTCLRQARACFLPVLALLTALIVPVTQAYAEVPAVSIENVKFKQLTAYSGVTEGEPVTYKITAKPAPTEDLKVGLLVTDYEDYLAPDQEGYKVAVIPANTESVDYIVQTQDDDRVDGKSAYINVFVHAHVIEPRSGGSGYRVFAGNYRRGNWYPEVTQVFDNDIPVASIVEVEKEITEGEIAAYKVSVDRQLNKDLTVHLHVAGDSKFLNSSERGIQTLVIRAGQMSANYQVATKEDTASTVGAANYLQVALRQNAAYRVGTSRTALTRIQDSKENTVKLSALNNDLTEGASRALTVELDSALGAGEVVSVQLTFRGKAQFGTDYTLSAPISPPTGVTYKHLQSAPTIIFTGPSSAKSATINLMATVDAEDEGKGELVVASIGPPIPRRVGPPRGTEGEVVKVSLGGTVNIYIVDPVQDAQGQAQQDEVLFYVAKLSLEKPKGADPATVKLVEDMIVRHRDVTGNTGALANWQKALKTLKGEPGGFTIAQLEEHVANLSGTPKQRWQRVLKAAKAMQDGSDLANTTPIVTISGGAAVTEGTAAGFTLSATPAPTADLAVALKISQSGSYANQSALGNRTVTIAAGQSDASFTVATQGDGVDEANGSIDAGVLSGSGYLIGSSSTARVPVNDDDVTEVVLSAPAGDIEEQLLERKVLSLELSRALVAGETLSVPLTLGGTATRSDYQLVANLIPVGVTYANLGDSAKAPTVTFTGPSAKSALLKMQLVQDNAVENDKETVTVELGALLTTGMSGGASGSGSVAFAILDAPVRARAQSADSATVKLVEDMIVRHREVTGNTGALANWQKALKTLKGEPGGFTIAQLEEHVANLSGTPKQRWQRVLKAAKAMQDGSDLANTTPIVTISGGAAVTEGTAAGFTLSATPAPTADLAVALKISQSGSYANQSALGNRTVTIAAGQSDASFTVATQGDGVDEANGSIDAGVLSGSGYLIGSSSTARVPVNDDDVTEVVLSAPAGDIEEQLLERKVLSLELSRALVAGETLSVPLTLGGTATRSDYQLVANLIPVGVTYANLGDSAKAPTVTFTGPSAKSALLKMQLVQDNAFENDKETVTVELGALLATGMGGGASGSGSIAFAILDAPVQARAQNHQSHTQSDKLLSSPVVSIAAKADSVVEGADAVFTVSVNPAPAADLAVGLSVSEAKNSDMVAENKEGTAKVIIPKGLTKADFKVATVDDSLDEPDGSVTVAIADDSGDAYAVVAAPKNSATVAVSDNDAEPTTPTLSIGDATLSEGKGSLMYFTVSLKPAAKKPVYVAYSTRETNPPSAVEDKDYLRASYSLIFSPGETEKRFFVYIFDDNHDEEAETFEVTIYKARYLYEPVGTVRIGDGVGVGTIVNSDPMPSAWLSRFGRTVAGQALDGITSRLSASRTPGTHGTLAGHPLDFTSESNNLVTEHSTFDALALQHQPVHSPLFDDDTQSQTLTASAELLGSRFTYTGEKDASGGNSAFWGRVTQSNFDGSEGAFSLDGSVSSTVLGSDYARDNWLMGFALMQSTSEGKYRDTKPDTRLSTQRCPAGVRADVCNGAVRKGDGKVDASLTAAISYGAFRLSEKHQMWGAAGYGSGEIELTPTDGSLHRSDISWTMAATGFRGDLLTPPDDGDGLSLALISDVLWTRTESEKSRDLAASNSDITRLRLGVEGSYHVIADDGDQVTTRLALRARQDGGDAETGSGIEVSTGIFWDSPARGLSLNADGRQLISHGEDGFKDRSFSAALAYAPGQTENLGPSFSLHYDWGGQSSDALDGVFASAPLVSRASDSNNSVGRWTTEAAYGFSVFSDRFTASPYVGLGVAQGTRDYAVGWRLTPKRDAPDLSLEVKSTQSVSDTSDSEHAIRINISAHW